MTRMIIVPLGIREMAGHRPWARYAYKSDDLLQGIETYGVPLPDNLIMASEPPGRYGPRLRQGVDFRKHQQGLFVGLATLYGLGPTAWFTLDASRSSDPRPLRRRLRFGRANGTSLFGCDHRAATFGASLEFRSAGYGL